MPVAYPLVSRLGYVKPPCTRDTPRLSHPMLSPLTNSTPGSRERMFECPRVTFTQSKTAAVSRPGRNLSPERETEIPELTPPAFSLRVDSAPDFEGLAAH